MILLHPAPALIPGPDVGIIEEMVHVQQDVHRVLVQIARQRLYGRPLLQLFPCRLLERRGDKRQGQFPIEPS